MGRRDDDGYEERRKLSWSEIDKKRDGKRSGGGGDRPLSPGSPRYSRYKSAADRFFSGDTMPEGLAEKLDPTGEGQARREALKALRQEEEFKTFITRAGDYVAKWGLPDDPYLLERFLTLPDESMVLQTLRHIEGLVDEGAFKAPKSLPQRLKALQLGGDDPDVEEAAAALAKKI